jgi:toxin ParE1/3/4
MAFYRLSRLAEDDLLRILSTSEERWGPEARRRYAATIAAAMRKVATDPKGLTTRDRAELLAGVRSMHLRHVRVDSQERVRHPVHVLYYRLIAPGLVEIIRVLHELMEPGRHLGSRIIMD